MDVWQKSTVTWMELFKKLVWRVPQQHFEIIMLYIFRIVDISLDVWQKSTVTWMEFSKSIEIPLVFWWLWNHEIVIVYISLDIWQKSIVTWMEFSKNIEIPMVFWWLWNHEIVIVDISLEVWQKPTVTWMELFKKWVWRGPQQHFEITKSKMLKYH